MKTYDLTMHRCPTNTVEALKILRSVAPGEEVEFLINPGDGTRNCLRRLKSQGHVVDQVRKGDKIHLVVRKAADHVVSMTFSS